MIMWINGYEIMQIKVLLSRAWIGPRIQTRSFGEWKKIEKEYAHAN